MTLTLIEVQKKLREMMENSIYGTGIDISKWNEKFDIDTPNLKVILKILDYVVLRMGYGGYGGTPAKDVKFDEFWAELLQHPEIMRMLYWYFSSEVPWETQLEFVCSMLDDIGLDWEWFWLDVEAINNKKSAGFALTAIRFLKAMKQRYPTKKIGLYSNKYFYQDWLRAYTAEVDEWPFWIAQYPWGNWITNLTQYFVSWWDAVFTTLTKRPSMPSSRSADEWEIWQLSDKTGFGEFFGLGGRDVDINITRRTWQQFIEYTGIPDRWKTTPEPPPDPPGDCSHLLQPYYEYMNSVGLEIGLIEESLGRIKSATPK